MTATQLEFCFLGCEQEQPPLPEHQPTGGCSCFAMGKKQGKREKKQQSAILLFIDWIPDAPQSCGMRSLCAGRQRAG